MRAQVYRTRSDGLSCLIRNRVDTAAGCVGGGAAGVRGCGGNNVDDRTGPVVCCPYEVCCGKDRHAVDRGKFFAPQLSGTTGRWSVHVNHCIGGADSDTRGRGRYRCLSERKRGLQPGDGGWRTVRRVSGGG